MNTHKVMLTIEIEAKAREGDGFNEKLLEQTFLDAVDTAVAHEALVLGDAPAWVICAEAREGHQGEDDDPPGRPTRELGLAAASGASA